MPSANTHQQVHPVYVPSMMRAAAPVRIAPPVTIRTVAPVFASVRKEEEPLPVRKVNIQNPAKSTMIKVDETRVQEKEGRTTSLVFPEEGSAKPISESAEETERAAEAVKEPERARERVENLKIC